MNKMISSLIYCFIVRGVLATEEESRSAYIKTRENKRLHGYVVKRIDSTDEMSCSKACLRHSWCTSSNFKESSGNCELNKREFSLTDDGTKLTDNPCTTFSMYLKVIRKVLNFHCLDMQQKPACADVPITTTTRLLHPGKAINNMMSNNCVQINFNIHNCRFKRS